MGVAAIIVALVLHTHAGRAQVLPAQPVWPATGTITSPFGRDGYRWHPGIDIGMLRSLTVRAADPGVVENVGEPAGFYGYGNIVEVRYGKYDELYAHLSSWHVKIGQKVRAGEAMAIAGCTGFCTGTHLHFEVRLHGVAVSPLATVLRALVSPTRVSISSKRALHEAENAKRAAERRLMLHLKHLRARQ
jgi:murein DD-endopeptidase MepM/ murein hydrolase activator NlpD